MTAEEKKAAKAAKDAKQGALDKNLEEHQQDTDETVTRFFELHKRAGIGLLFFLRLLVFQ